MGRPVEYSSVSDRAETSSSGSKTILDDLDLSHARPNLDSARIRAIQPTLAEIHAEQQAKQVRKGKTVFSKLPAERFEKMNVAGRFTGFLDRARANDIGKIAEWMPEWNATVPLSREQKYRMSVVSHYINGDVGDIALEHLNLDLDIQALDNERARRTSPVRTQAPLHRENALLSMLDRYETETRIESIIDAENAAEKVIVEFPSSSAEPLTEAA